MAIAFARRNIKHRRWAMFRIPALAAKGCVIVILEAGFPFMVCHMRPFQSDSKCIDDSRSVQQAIIPKQRSATCAGSP